MTDLAAALREKRAPNPLLTPAHKKIIALFAVVALTIAFLFLVLA